MFDWMDFVALTTKQTIWHGRNHGEVKVGKYKLDGYCMKTKTAYEFDGCHFHGCEECYQNKVEDQELESDGTKMTKEEILKRRREETIAKREFLIRKGYNVVKITECEYKKDVKIAMKARRHKNTPNLFDFVKSRLPPFYRKFRVGEVKEKTILEAVQSGLLYGMVEVDIKVPDHLHEKFSEMSPLFHTIDVPIEDIGIICKII